MPVFLFELPQGIFYGFPKIDDRGVKVSEHSGGEELEFPEAIDRSLRPADEKHLVEFLEDHLPGVSNQVTRHAACMYTMSRDENFIIDQHPLHENVVLATGMSGHGFKFTSVLGEILADLAIQGRSNLPIEFLSLDRFTNSA